MLADEGAAGLVICGRNTVNGAAVKAALEEKGCPTVYVKADLSNEADCKAVVAAADVAFGRLDGLVTPPRGSARPCAF